MTRLITPWIDQIAVGLSQHDHKVNTMLGMDIFSLAAKAAGGTAAEFSAALCGQRGAVIPITAGQGMIPSFAQSVSAILNYMGLTTQVSSWPDVSGIEEAVRGGADILFMADDQRYIALNVRTGRLAENDVSTALGYVTGLEAMAGDLAGQSVLVLGCGSVGQLAIGYLEKKGAHLALYDKEQSKVEALAKGQYEVLKKKAEIKNYPFIFDATNEGGWINSADLHPQVRIAAPGVPLSFDSGACQLCASRLLHDPLQTGTAVMLSTLVMCAT